jgi:hypothetical protein
MCANDGIDRARIAAVTATNAGVFIDDGDSWLRRLREREHVFAKQSRQALDGCLPTGRTQINVSARLYDCGGVRATARVATLCALRLRQQVVDRFDEVALARRQLP